jgi:hypothetical protein
MRRETYLWAAKGTTKKSTNRRPRRRVLLREWRGAPVLRNRRGRMRGTDGSRSRRIEGQAPRAGGSSARLGTKKHLLAFDLGVAELRHETLNMGCDRLALLVERH